VSAPAEWEIGAGLKKGDLMERTFKRKLSITPKQIKPVIAIRLRRRSNLVFRKFNLLGIAEPVPNEVRNLLVCFGVASQPLRSSQ